MRRTPFGAPEEPDVRWIKASLLADSGAEPAEAESMSSTARPASSQTAATPETDAASVATNATLNLESKSRNSAGRARLPMETPVRPRRRSARNVATQAGELGR